MTLTTKETLLLKDLRSQEQLCIDKYAKGAAEACDQQLKDLFTRLRENETQHLQTLDQIASGTVPQLNQNAGGKTYPQITPSTCQQDQKNKDAYLCSDALSMEKHVSATYNTSIFEFVDVNARNVLNHIQKEEQEHGEQLYNYMSVNGMYC